MTWILKVLLPIVLPFILGQLTSWVMAGVKKVFSWVGAQPALAQQILVGGIGVALAALAKMAGVQLPCDPTTASCDVTSWGSAVWTGFLSAVVAFILHNAAKTSAAAPPA